MSIDAGASVAPPKVPISVGLLSRQSITGALVVGLVSLFFLVVIPILAPIVNTSAFQVGRPYVSAGGVQITPLSGWTLEGDSVLFTNLAKGGATLTLTTPAEPTGTLEDAAQISIDGLKATQGWSVGDPVTFVTDAGAHGVYVYGTTATDAVQTWIVDSGGTRLTMFGGGPDSVWPSLIDEMNAMVNSVVFPVEAAQ